MRVLIVTGGTRGDVDPLFALHRALERAGHSVLFAGPPDFAHLRERGVDYLPVGSEARAWAEDWGRRPPTRAVLRETARAELELHVRTLLPHLEGVDVVLGCGGAYAASTLAEAAGASFWRVAFCPIELRSRRHPPAYVPLQLRSLPSLVCRALWQLHRVRLDDLLRDELNGHRRALGLRPATDTWHCIVGDRVLLACDTLLANAPPDWPGHVVQTGAWRTPSSAALAPELERFLAAGPTPVFAGLSSQVSADAAATTAALVGGARRAGLRLVLARGWDGLGEGVEDEDVLVVDGAPHDALVRRVAAVVHHGGAGTIAAAARAGVPQLAIPISHDQYYWARRIHRAGLGPGPIPIASLSASRVTRGLRDLVLRDRYRSAAFRLRNALAGEPCSVSLAVRHIEAQESSSRPAAAR